MKAIRVQKPGGRDVLQYTDVPEPRPERGQVLDPLLGTGIVLMVPGHEECTVARR